MNTVTRTLTITTMQPEPLAYHVGKVRMATIVEPFIEHPLAIIAGQLYELRLIKA